MEILTPYIITQHETIWNTLYHKRIFFKSKGFLFSMYFGSILYIVAKYIAIMAKGTIGDDIRGHVCTRGSKNNFYYSKMQNNSKLFENVEIEVDINLFLYF